MKNYWVIGHPLSFCLTTPVMNGAFEALGIDARFETKDISPENLEDVMKKLKIGELDGLMITRPHKTPSLKVVDEPSDICKAIDAVSVILKKDDGRLWGENINVIGAVRAVKEAMQLDEMDDMTGQHVHVLGAGGAARAAAYGFQQEGAKVSIWNRTGDRARQYAEAQGIEWVEDMRDWDGHPDVIINATSASSQPRQSTLVPFPLWKNVQVAMDAVYGKTSLFLEEAKAAQVPHVLSGEVWFLKQTLPFFELLTGQKAPAELIEKLTHEANAIKQT